MSQTSRAYERTYWKSIHQNCKSNYRRIKSYLLYPLLTKSHLVHLLTKVPFNVIISIINIQFACHLHIFAFDPQINSLVSNKSTFKIGLTYMKANLEAKMTFSITFFSLSTKILANNLYKFPSKLIGLRLLDPLPHAFS